MPYHDLTLLDESPPSSTFAPNHLSDYWPSNTTANFGEVMPASVAPILKPVPPSSTLLGLRTTSIPPSSSVSHTSNSPLSSGDKIERKRKNTEAARRYRQRKVDRVTELEEALTAVSRERDELKLKLARAEMEAEVLRGIVKYGR